MKQLDLPFIPYHNHDSDTTPYLGSEMRGDKSYDYYYSPQMGMPTVIARYGEYGDYVSGLSILKSNINKDVDTEAQLTVLRRGSDETLALLATAATLSIQQGYLNTELKATALGEAINPTHPATPAPGADKSTTTAAKKPKLSR